MLTLFYAPQTRATGVRILLEELGAPYDLHVLRLRRNEQHAPDFLAINPLGKVPAILHDGAVITEQAAIYQYLAELFPERGLAPPIGDRLRGPYLRWLAFYGASFEPAMIDKHLQRDPGQAMMSPYGSYDRVVDALEQQLGAGPFMLGERFSAVDVLWGVALGWMLQFGMLPKRPAFTAFAGRIAGRAASRKVTDEDAALAAMQPE
ncbi:MAG: glutathione S-transferase family protein [Acetobacteraceae bacterium]|nr:glutathione S-transferase family protein [Acetobacteraceae bacterium]